MSDKQQFKPGYKKIEGKIPLGWTPKRLKEVIKDIGDGGTPSRKKKEYFDGNIPWIVIKDIKKKIFDTREHLSEEGLKNSSAKLWPKNTVILSFGATIGEVGIARVPVTTKQGIAGIVPDTEQITPEFLYYLLQFHKNLLIRFAHQTTISEIRPPILKELMFAFPSFPEQQKIAEVLSTADEAIQKTDEIIERTQELKKGLMQKLLTKGIGHTKFKQTKIEEIPEEWEVARLGDVLSVCQYGLSIKLFSKGKYPILRMDNLEGGYIVTDDLTYVNIDEGLFNQFKLEKGDILFNRTNAYDLVGKVGIFLLDGDYTFASYLIRIRTSPEKANPLFVNHYLNADATQNRLKSLATRGISQANINAKNLKSLLIPIPHLPEQQKIAEILSTVDEKIEKEKLRKEQLEKLKKGLMQDLLTGRVKVKVN